MPINEIMWATTLIFMFLVLIGFIKHDAVLLLFSVVAGILLTLEFYNSSPYLGFAMACISIYIAYHALIKEWQEKPSS